MELTAESSIPPPPILTYSMYANYSVRYAHDGLCLGNIIHTHMPLGLLAPI